MRSPSNNTDELTSLLAAIHMCASDPLALRAVLRALNQYIGGTCVQLFTLDRLSRTVQSCEISESGEPFQDFNRRYVDRWAEVDPRTAMLCSSAPGKVLRCDREFDGGFIASSPFYTDFFLPHGLRWSLASLFEAGPHTATVLAIARSADLPPFDDWAENALRQLLPHFQQVAAIRQRRELVDASASVVEVLKALPIPCILTDSRGRCIERNQAFSDSMQLLSVRLAVGRVRFESTGLQNSWEMALSMAHTTAVRQTVPMSSASGRPWRVHLVPIGAVLTGAEAPDGRMILAVFDDRPVETMAPAAAATARIRLTRAERDVLGGMLRGLPAKAIANERGASVNTVRSQIMAILEKTGHSSQKELIASYGASAFGSSTFSPSAFTSSSFSPISLGAGNTR